MYSSELRQREVRPGSTVALIAPSSPFDVTAFKQGVSRLGQRYRVDVAPDITARSGFLAGDDARRLHELRRALQRPDVAAIVAARGGYGSTRILPLIAAEEVRAYGPRLAGFSDVTALHALWARAGVASLHSSMVAHLGICPEPQFDRFCAALEDRGGAELTGLERWAGGHAEGILLGGNLAVLCALLGTPEFPPLAGAVLFLEDIGERPYRIDRMLTSLRHAGSLQGVRAIVLGAFTDCEAGPDGTSAYDVLRERLCDLGIPISAGLPAGHIADNHELPFGRRVTLDADAGCLRIHTTAT